MRPVASLVLFLFLSGCVLFAPPFSEELEKNLSEGYKSISKVTACIDLGLCSTRSSFKNNEEAYTSAVASLKTARLIAGGMSTRIGSAGEDLVGLIDGCIAQIDSLSKIHRASGVPANVGISQPVIVACDQPLRAAQALK